MRIGSHEVEITGDVVVEDGRRRKGPLWERIDWLTEHALELLAHHHKWGMWRTLFRDPVDGRLWERTFPESEYHGGGPPRLAEMSQEKAREEYAF